MTRSDDQLDVLLGKLTDGDLSDAELSELDTLLRADPAARQQYISWMALHARLRVKHATPAEIPATPTSDEESEVSPAQTSPRRKSLLQWASRHPKGPAIAIAATVLIAALVVLGLLPVSKWIAGGKGDEGRQREAPAPSEFVAILNGSQDDVWADGTRPSLGDPRLKVGRRLVLRSGLIELKYYSGARVVIEGPAEFIVGGRQEAGGGSQSGERKAESGNEIARSSTPRSSLLNPNSSLANSGYLKLGKLVARVEGEEAQGFTIETPTARVEDLGTEFGVEVDRQGAAEFVVLSGKVDVVLEKGDGSEHRLRLAKDQGAFVGATNRAILRHDQVDPKFIAEMRSKLKAIDVASAAVAPMRVSSTRELAFRNDVSAQDLLHGLTAATTGWNLSSGASPARLNDGVYGTSYDDVGDPAVATIAWTTAGATATYDLGLGTHGAGWNITAIQTIAAWNSAAFGNQAYTVHVKLKGAAEFTKIAEVDYQPLKEVGATKVRLANEGGVLASGVELIRFTADHVNNVAHRGAFTFREIDVFGVETTPSATAGERTDGEGAIDVIENEDTSPKESAEDAPAENRSNLRMSKSEMKE